MYFVYLGSRRTQVDLTQSGYIVDLESMAESATTFYQISAISIIYIDHRAIMDFDWYRHFTQCDEDFQVLANAPTLVRFVGDHVRGSY